MSKKEMLILGALAIGGIGIATMVSDSGDAGGGLEGGRQVRAGGILGAQQGYGAPTMYNLPAQPAVTFPEAPTFDISKLLEPISKPAVSRGAAGVSAAPKKVRGVTPYLYTGGEVKAGAVSLAPWAAAPTPPKPYIYTSGEIKAGAISVAPWAMVTPVVKRDDPSTWRTRKQFMTTSKGVDPRTAAKYPGISKKEASSLAATKERLST